jgi:hypothetical protein
MKKKEMFRYLAEPRNILPEPLGSAEPRLKNTAIGSFDKVKNHLFFDHFYGFWQSKRFPV